jgi:uncharacterized RDD family membrane protein YckC
MGQYVPTKTGKRRSISEALQEAEHDHYLDCPNADFLIRVAAFLLDAIFLFLLVTGMNRILTIILASPIGIGTGLVSDDTRVLVTSLQAGLQCTLFYFYGIWPVFRFGGSAGKLILGLRIVDRDTGQKLTYVQLLLREVLGKLFLGPVTLGVAFLMPLWREDSLALHDLLSRSAVKKVRNESV